MTPSFTPPTLALLPLEAVGQGLLIRDRSARVDPEIGDLVASIRATGLANPIRVAEDGAGGFQLVQGWRRLAAFRALHAETGDPAFARIPAHVMQAGETVAGLYRRMVDENLVRKDISFAEMARLARAYAAEGVEGCDSIETAVSLLYASATPQRRHAIRRFALLLGRLDKHLDHPEAIPRDLGLAVAQRLDDDPAAIRRLVLELGAQRGRGAAAELAALRAFAIGTPATVAEPLRDRKGEMLSFRMQTVAGPVRLRAYARRLTLETGLDLRRADRALLAQAAEAFFATLGGGDQR
jgi:ParB family chromosome partitioning protein